MSRYTPSELRGAALFSPGQKTRQAMLRQAADDALDAERWRWLVAENNKGGSRAKFLICWWSKDGDGYESTTGTSVNGRDPETIVRMIDIARTPTGAHREK